MSGGGGAAAGEDEVTKLQRYIDERETEVKAIQGQVDKLKAALDKEPFEPVGRLKTSDAANTELQQLRAEKAESQKLLHADKEQLRLWRQAAAGECNHHKQQL
jgi:SMC interacting uncharacterized protein involved in chromosome segregation